MTDCIYFKKKKKNFWKIRVNSTRLATRLNPWPVWPATRLTRLKMTRFDPRPDWPDPNPTRPARFAMSTNETDTKQRLTHVLNPTPFLCLNSFNNTYLLICCHMPPYSPTRKNKKVLISNLNTLLSFILWLLSYPYIFLPKFK